MTLGKKSIEEAFQEFHVANPDVYRQLVSEARALKSRGHRRIGIGMLWEVLRWQRMRLTVGDDFKLNNNYRSRYARVIMENEADLVGMFDTREITSP